MKVTMNGLTWTKTTRRHALGHRYAYFIQLNRGRSWYIANPRVRKLAESLQKLYGPSTTRDPVVDPESGKISYYKHILNDNWFVDSARHRVYIADEKTLTYMALMS